MRVTGLINKSSNFSKMLSNETTKNRMNLLENLLFPRPIVIIKDMLRQPTWGFPDPIPPTVTNDVMYIDPRVLDDQTNNSWQSYVPPPVLDPPLRFESYFGLTVCVEGRPITPEKEFALFIHEKVKKHLSYETPLQFHVPRTPSERRKPWRPFRRELKRTVWNGILQDQKLPPYRPLKRERYPNPEIRKVKATDEGVPSHAYEPRLVYQFKKERPRRKRDPCELLNEEAWTHLRTTHVRSKLRSKLILGKCKRCYPTIRYEKKFEETVYQEILSMIQSRKEGDYFIPARNKKNELKSDDDMKTERKVLQKIVGALKSGCKFNFFFPGKCMLCESGNDERPVPVIYRKVLVDLLEGHYFSPEFHVRSPKIPNYELNDYLNF